jgi:hypothetical protein
MSTATEEIAKDQTEGEPAESEEVEDRQKVEPYWPWPPLL